MDTISLLGIRVLAYHGVLAEEQSTGQEFVIDVIMYTDVAGAASSDDLGGTVDYGTLAAAIHARVSGERWNLIETVAARIADLVLENRGVAEVVVRVHKPAAPISVPFEDVVVEVHRSR